MFCKNNYLILILDNRITALVINCKLSKLHSQKFKLATAISRCRRVKKPSDTVVVHVDVYFIALADTGWLLMAQSHCTGPGVEPGTGPATKGYYILYRTAHTALGPGRENRPIVSCCTSPVSCTCPRPVPMQCERAIRLLGAAKAWLTVA